MPPLPREVWHGPVTLTLLATAIISIVTELAKTVGGRGAELLSDAGADDARARDELRAALQAALAEIAQDSALYALWYDTFPKLQHDNTLTQQPPSVWCPPSPSARRPACCTPWACPRPSARHWRVSSSAGATG